MGAEEIRPDVGALRLSLIGSDDTNLFAEYDDDNDVMSWERSDSVIPLKPKPY